jgi:hypothetical protein
VTSHGGEKKHADIILDMTQHEVMHEWIRSDHLFTAVRGPEGGPPKPCVVCVIFCACVAFCACAAVMVTMTIQIEMLSEKHLGLA